MAKIASAYLAAKSTALGRGAGLQDRRAVLRRAHDVERPARLEELALVLDAAHLAASANMRAVAVHHHRVLVPARPQLAADLDELVGAVVAHVGRRPVDAEIGVLVVVDRGDDVPAGAAVGEMIERRPQPRGIERMMLADREGRGHADMLVTAAM